MLKWMWQLQWMLDAHSLQTQKSIHMMRTSCPERVKNIRNVIVELDKQIEEALKNETTDA